MRSRAGSHLGLDEAGVDRVDADAVAAELDGEGLGEAADAELRGGVAVEAFTAAQPLH
jgi:hypothetical protein